MAAILRRLAQMAGGMGGGGKGDDANILGDVEKATTSATSGLRQMLGIMDDISAKNLSNLIPTLEDLKNPIKGLKRLALAYAVEGLKMGASLEKVQQQVRQTTGLTDLYTESVLETVRAQSNIGMSLEEYSEAMGGLAGEVSLLPTLNEVARRSLMKTTTELKRLGVDSATAGKAFEVLTRTMKQVPLAANETLRSFDMLAQQVGLSTKAIIADFAQLSPQITKYGGRTDKVFTKLAKTARAFGVTTQEAFGFADQFDTWAGAAETVGKLNAQFAQYGLQLDDIALMEMDEADRIKEINRQFKAAGLAVDEFGRRELQMLADVATQGDVNLASKLFGDPEDIEDYMKTQDTMAKRAEDFTTSMQRIGAAIQAVFIDSGLAQAAAEVMEDLAESLKDVQGPMDLIMKLGGGLISAVPKILWNAGFTAGNDVILRPNEPPILLNEDDTIIAGTGLATKGGKGGMPNKDSMGASGGGMSEQSIKRAFVAAMQEFGAAKGDVSKMKFEANGREIGRIATNEINKTNALGQPA